MGKLPGEFSGPGAATTPTQFVGSIRDEASSGLPAGQAAGGRAQITEQLAQWLMDRCDRQCWYWLLNHALGCSRLGRHGSHRLSSFLSVSPHPRSKEEPGCKSLLSVRSRFFKTLGIVASCCSGESGLGQLV